MEAGLSLGSKHPVRARITDGMQVADRHVQPHPIIASACFQKQYAAVGIARQPVGKNAARRAGTDDDVVVLSVQSRHGGYEVEPVPEPIDPKIAEPKRIMELKKFNEINGRDDMV
jgi:hypothetical protein